MKHVVARSLVVLVLVLAVSSFASAERGYVFVGADVLGIGVDVNPVIDASFAVTDEVTLGATYYPQDQVFGVRAEYGADRGLYTSTFLDSGEFVFWRVGGFFGDNLTDQLSYRVLVGVVNILGNLYPEVALEYDYHLSDPLAIRGAVYDGGLRIGLAYEY